MAHSCGPVLSMPDTLADNPRAQRLLARESVAREPHAWVRLTNSCNNHCMFCLDTDAKHRSAPRDDAVVEEVRRGRLRGATKLILSGGEASIHPRFLEFVALGARLGYRKIQAISNGRMFAYPEFLQRARRAGLTELTVSIHGHTAELHDRLVGVSGAFEQAVAALSQALGRLVVNIDVCLNRENIQHLPELIERFTAMGVREFDLLHLIPFGRAFERFDELSYDAEQAMPALRRAIEFSRQANVQLWFNRLPAAYLEGFEELIQDPWKLHDEVRGRQVELQRAIEMGEPLPCESPGRCPSCHMHGYCAALKKVRNWLERGTAMLRTNASEPPRQAATLRNTIGLWVRARNVDEACGLRLGEGAEKAWLELESYQGLDLSRLVRELGVQRIERVIVASLPQLEGVLAADDQVQVTALLTPAIVEELAARHDVSWSRVAVVAPGHLSLRDALSAATDVRDVCHRLPLHVPIEGLPRCITKRTSCEPSAVVDARSLDASGHIDPLGFVQQYITDFAYVRSLRCARCADAQGCRGVHLNFVRAQGFGDLRPLDGPIQGK